MKNVDKNVNVLKVLVYLTYDLVTKIKCSQRALHTYILYVVSYCLVLSDQYPSNKIFTMEKTFKTLINRLVTMYKRIVMTSSCYSGAKNITTYR